VAIVPGIPAAHTRAETLVGLQENLVEVLELCLKEMDPVYNIFVVAWRASRKSSLWSDLLGVYIFTKYIQQENPPSGRIYLEYIYL